MCVCGGGGLRESMCVSMCVCHVTPMNEHYYARFTSFVADMYLYFLQIFNIFRLLKGMFLP